VLRKWLNKNGKKRKRFGFQLLDPHQLLHRELRNDRRLPFWKNFSSSYSFSLFKTAAPITTSAWPFIYLVNEYTTISAPRVNGFYANKTACTIRSLILALSFRHLNVFIIDVKNIFHCSKQIFHSDIAFHTQGRKKDTHCSKIIITYLLASGRSKNNATWNIYYSTTYLSIKTYT